MHIDFKRLILHNFMSFGDADIRFEDDGFIKVSGRNENPLDNAGSNGSGKSSIWEALVWAITGETIRGTKQVVNAFGEDGCFVDVEFYIDATRYQIIRAKDHKVRKNSIQILINGEDVSGKGVRDSEKLLQQYLPDVTASLLGSVIVLGQGLPQKFTNNTPSGRKEVLEQLSKSDFMIEDLKGRVSNRRSQLTTELREFEDAIIKIGSQMTFINQQTDDCQNKLNSINKEALLAEQHNYTEQEAELQAQVDATESTLSSNTQLHQHMLTDKAALESEETKQMFALKEDYIAKTQVVTSRKQELLYQLNNNTDELRKLKTIKDVCPTCGQKLPNVHKPDTTQQEQEIERLQQELNIIDTQLQKETESYNASLKSLADAYKMRKLEINKEFTNLGQCCNELRAKKDQLSASKAAVSKKLSATQLQLAQLDATINDCLNIIRNNNELITSLQNELMYNNKQRDLTQSKIDVITKFDTALKRDFRGYLLSTVIDYIEERAKYYSTIIFDNTNVTFALDGNNIDIRYFDRPYENLSGGEKQKIDLIIQFSIRDMLSSQLGFTSNVLVLDEVFDGLDATGCARVIDMIASLSDIKNIFIVTHRKDLSIPCDKQLIVVKSPAGISEIA